MKKKFMAELIGTAWFVLCGCGALVFAGRSGVMSLSGQALALGFAYLSISYALTAISGCHLNPVVSVGLAAARRLPWSQLPIYIAGQLTGALFGATLLFLLVTGNEYYNPDMGFAANGYGRMSPGLYNAFSAFMTELILSFFLILIILGSTARRAASGLAPMAVGFAYVVIALITIPITNGSVNPARATSQALFVNGTALHQLWLFWVAPMLGSLLGAIFYRNFFADE